LFFPKNSNHTQVAGRPPGRLSKAARKGETIDHLEKDCRRLPEGCSEAKSTGMERVNKREISQMASLLKAGGTRQAVFAAFLQTHSQAGLHMGFKKYRSIRFANIPIFSDSFLLVTTGVIGG
jgi:hypothetical protein